MTLDRRAGRLVPLEIDAGVYLIAAAVRIGLAHIGVAPRVRVRACDGGLDLQEIGFLQRGCAFPIAATLDRGELSVRGDLDADAAAVHTAAGGCLDAPGSAAVRELFGLGPKLDQHK